MGITLCTVSYQQYDDDDNPKNIWTKVVTPTTKRRYCDVLERNDNDDTYTVRIHTAKQGPVVVEQVPRGEGGVELVDQLHSADWHLGSAFRHYIQIPDDVLPEAWK